MGDLSTGSSSDPRPDRSIRPTGEATVADRTDWRRPSQRSAVEPGAAAGAVSSWRRTTGIAGRWSAA